MRPANVYVAVVRGTYGTAPRGYPWVFLVWYSIVGACIGYEIGRLLGVLGGLVILGAGMIPVFVLRGQKRRAFRADAQGLRLGMGDRSIWIPWTDTRRIVISPRTDGARVDVIVAPSALPDKRRRSPAAEILLSLLPGSGRFVRSPLLTPLTDPPRYSAPLWGTTGAEVADSLRPLTPESVAIITRT